MKSIHPTQTNPLILYKKVVGDKMKTFTFQQVNMSQLLREISNMKPTTSAGADMIPMKAIKAAITELAPLILNMVNQTIAWKTFPTKMKTTKIKPIRKKEKEGTDSDGWRPVNIVQSLSKVIERTYLRQILKHLDENKLINHSHHGGLKNKSTQTVINEIHDGLMEALAKGKDAALIMINQSKAFDLIDHKILIQKLRLIGFCNQALEIMESFLRDQRQYVQVQAEESQCLMTGPRSVVQGSVLSGALYLVYILDLPYLMHKEIHNPEKMRECSEPNIKTFIDDCLVKIKRKEDKKIEDEVVRFMEKMEDYAAANLLAINPEKTKIVVVSKEDKIKEEFEVKLKGKVVKHSKEIKVLGIKITDNMMWDRHVENILIPQLKNRVRTYGLISKYLGPKFRRIYANACYRSKLMYGIESWGGVQKTLVTKLQNIQDKMTKLTLGRDGRTLSARQRQRKLYWLPISKEIELAACKMTYRLINNSIPEELSTVMPLNTKGLRIKEQKKLDTKPSWITKSKSSRASFRSRAYVYNTLPSVITTQETYKKFKKSVKQHFLDMY